MWADIQSLFGSQPEPEPTPTPVTIEVARFPADGTCPQLVHLRTTLQSNHRFSFDSTYRTCETVGTSQIHGGIWTELRFEVTEQ